MRKEAKIAMSVFAFYLIFGLNELFGIGQRFIVPHILDDIILFIVSIVFIVGQNKLRRIVPLFAFTLFAFFGFLSAPAAAMLFEHLFDVNAFANFIRSNETTILQLYLASFVLLSLTTLGILPKYLNQKNWSKFLFVALGLTILILVPISLYLSWSLHFYAISVFCLTSAILVRYEQDFTLESHHYAFLMLHLIASMLTILEYVSLSGLLAF